MPNSAMEPFLNPIPIPLLISWENKVICKLTLKEVRVIRLRTLCVKTFVPIPRVQVPKNQLGITEKFLHVNSQKHSFRSPNEQKAFGAIPRNPNKRKNLGNQFLSVPFNQLGIIPLS